MSFDWLRRFNKYYAPLTIRYNSDKMLWKAHREINGHKIEFYYRPFSLDEFIMKEIFNDNAYKVKKEIYQNGKIIDLGAHIGLFSLLANCYAEEVISFEPDYRNIRLYRLNEAINGITEEELPKLSLLRYALDGSQSPTTSMYFYPNTGNNTCIPFPFNGKEVKEIPNADINSFLPCDVLKMDIEGSEYDVFKSIQNLNDIHKAFTIEIHYHVPNWKDKLNYMIQTLTSNGFKVEFVKKYSYNGHIYAERKL
jgi:FkbM family methyltransferase